MSRFLAAIRTSRQVEWIGIFFGMIYRYDARDAGILLSVEKTSSADAVNGFWPKGDNEHVFTASLNNV